MIAIIPFNKISKVQIYINTNKKTLAEIKKETGADYIINGTLYDMSTYKAVCHLKSNDKIYCKPDYTTWGYSWNNNEIPTMEVLANNDQNNIACVCMIRNSEKQKMQYDSALGGKRGRSAIGTTKDSFILYCIEDGSKESLTPESLQDYMASQGCKDAIMLDGGGSSQCNFNGYTIVSKRKVQNLILVYIKKEVDSLSTKKVMLDPGHDANNVNGSPDGTYKENEFTLDMGNRMKKILERCGVQVYMTRTDGKKISLEERCKLSNSIKDLNLFVSLHSNAAGNSGWYSAKGWSIFTSVADDTAQRNIAANEIIKEIQKINVETRNPALKHNLYYVLKNTTAPAVLIEHGFHTNKEDVELLKQDNYRSKLAIAQCKGICNYLGIKFVEDEEVKEETNNNNSTHWAQSNFDNLVARGVQLSDTRFDDNITRGEAFALADKILTALGK